MKKLCKAVFLAILMTACQQGTMNSSEGPISNLDVSGQLFTKSLTVCDPLGSDQSTGELRSGLQGRLYYLDNTMPRFTSVEDYVRAIDTGKDIFLNDLNVPTRMFDQGFPVADGSLLMANNQVLVEWFELFLETQIVLTPQDQDGDYELAMISDDGGTMETIGSNEQYSRHIDNDGTHSSRLGCAATTVSMNHNMALPSRIKYYQGPATEIALMLLWRKVPASGQTPEPLCGATGQNLYFEYHNNPSTPQQAYQDLLSRGWKPLSPGNFVIPGNNRINPCNSNSNWAS